MPDHSESFTPQVAAGAAAALQKAMEHFYFRLTSGNVHGVLGWRPWWPTRPSAPFPTSRARTKSRRVGASHIQ